MKLAEITTVFNYNNSVNKYGESPIHVRIYYQGKRKLIATGIHVLPTQWDGRKVKGHPKRDSFNFRIRSLLNQLESNQDALVDLRRTYNIQDIIGFNVEDELQNDSFIDFVEGDLNTRTDLTLGTRKNHKVFIKRFQEFKKSLTFSEVDYSLLLDFEMFLRLYEFTKAGEIRKLGLPRVSKYLKTFQSYILRAVGRGLLEESKNPFKRFDWSIYNKAEALVRKKIRYLAPEDVQALELLNFSKRQRHLERIRDFFLLQCYTGLAYSDMIRLSAGNINLKMVKGRSGLVINIDRKKTDEPVYVPVFLISKRGEDLLKKYRQNDKPRLFDNLTNMHINRELKVIGQMAEIEKVLSTHVGRHTCGMLLLNKGIPLDYISKILGHGDTRTTRIYADVNPNIIDNMLISKDILNG